MKTPNDIDRPQLLFDGQARRAETLETHGFKNPSLIGMCEEEIRAYVSASLWLKELKVLSLYVTKEAIMDNLLGGAKAKLNKLKKSDEERGNKGGESLDEIMDALDKLVRAKEAGTLYLIGKADPLEGVEVQHLQQVGDSAQSDVSSDEGEIAKRSAAMRKQQTGLAKQLGDLASTFEAKNGETIQEIAEKVRVAKKAEGKAAADLAIKTAQESVAEGAHSLTTRPSKGTIFDPLMEIIEELDKLENFDMDESTGVSRKKVNIKQSLATAEIDVEISDDLNVILGYIMERKKDGIAGLAQQRGTAIKRALSTAREIHLDREFKEGLSEVCNGIVQIVQEGPDMAKLDAIVKGHRLLTAWRETKGDGSPELGDSYEGNRRAWKRAIKEDIPKAEEELAKAEARLKSAKEKAVGTMRAARRIRVTLTLLFAGLTGVSGAYLGGKTTGLSEDEVLTLQDTAHSEGHTAGLAEGRAAGRQATLAELATVLGLTDLGENPTVDSIVTALAGTNEGSDLWDMKNDLNEIIQIALSKMAYRNITQAWRAAEIKDVSSLTTPEQVTAAKTALLNDLIQRALKSDDAEATTAAATQAARVLRELRELKDPTKSRITGILRGADEHDLADTIERR